MAEAGTRALDIPVIFGTANAPDKLPGRFLLE
jgi:hypothetical protein